MLMGVPYRFDAKRLKTPRKPCSRTKNSHRYIGNNAASHRIDTGTWTEAIIARPHHNKVKIILDLKAKTYICMQIISLKRACPRSIGIIRIGDIIIQWDACFDTAKKANALGITKK